MNGSVYIIQCPPSWIKTAPLSLVYLENYLKANNIKVCVRDLNAEIFRLFQFSPKEWLSLNAAFEENLFAKLANHHLFLKSFYAEIKEYEYIGFSVSKRNSNFSFALARKIKEIFPSKKIIFGGPHVLFVDQKNMLDSESFWVVGEGERPLLNILCGLNDKTQRFKELEDLDRLTFLDFSCLNMGNYSASIPLLSSRGCKFGCNFCSERKLYNKFRQHSPSYVCDLISSLVKKHRTNTFVFCDSLINYNHAWLEKFCSTLIKNKTKIKWEAQMRIDNNFDISLGALMKESGCYNLFVGMESASENTLRNMNKGFTPDIALSFIEKLSRAGLQFEISLIFGYPTETKTDFKETLDFIVKNKKLIPKIAQANPFVDYFNVSGDKYPSDEAKSRIFEFVKTLEKEKIRYTKSFINNLIY